MKWLLSALLIFFCITSCASHNPIPTTALTRGTEAEKKKVSENGIDLVISPILSEAVMEAYFDQDLLKYDILPVQVAVLNNSAAPLRLTQEALCLTNTANEPCPRLSVDEVVRRLKKSYWRSVGWGAALGLMGAIPSAINVSMTNEKMAFYYKTRELKTEVLSVGACTEGVVFFDIPKDTEVLDGWALELRFHTPTHPAPRVLTYALAGDLSRK